MLSILVSLRAHARRRHMSFHLRTIWRLYELVIQFTAFRSNPYHHRYERYQAPVRTRNLLAQPALPAVDMISTSSSPSRYAKSFSSCEHSPACTRAFSGPQAGDSLNESTSVMCAATKDHRCHDRPPPLSPFLLFRHFKDHILPAFPQTMHHIVKRPGRDGW